MHTLKARTLVRLPLFRLFPTAATTRSTSWRLPPSRPRRLLMLARIMSMLARSMRKMPQTSPLTWRRTITLQFPLRKTTLTTRFCWLSWRLLKARLPASRAMIRFWLMAPGTPLITRRTPIRLSTTGRPTAQPLSWFSWTALYSWLIP